MARRRNLAEPKETVFVVRRRVSDESSEADLPVLPDCGDAEIPPLAFLPRLSAFRQNGNAMRRDCDGH